MIKQVRTRLCTPPQKRRDGVSIRRIRCEVFGGFHSNAFIFLLVLIPSTIFVLLGELAVQRVSVVQPHTLEAR